MTRRGKMGFLHIQTVPQNTIHLTPILMYWQWYKRSYGDLQVTLTLGNVKPHMTPNFFEAGVVDKFGKPKLVKFEDKIWQNLRSGGQNRDMLNWLVMVSFFD